MGELCTSSLEYIIHPIKTRFIMKKAIFPFLLALLGFSAVYARDFRPGYVVTSAGDTLRGEINHGNATALCAECLFRPDGQATATRYLPGDLAAYRFEGGQYFLARPLEGAGLVFLEVLVQGELDVYYYKKGADEHYYVEKAGMPFTEVPAVNGSVTIDGRTYERNNQHVGTLSYFTQDAPALQRDIAKMPRLNPANMIHLAEAYHGMVCTDGSPCVVYQAVLPKVRVGIELQGGAFRVFRDKADEPENELWAGVPSLYIYLFLPRVSEHFFLRAGFSPQWFGKRTWYNSLGDQYRGETSDPRDDQFIFATRNHFHKIPVQVGYRFGKGVVRPKVAAGISLYLPDWVITSAMAGADFFVAEHVALTLSYDIDFAPWNFRPFAPAFRGGQSVQAGVHFEF